ncbi:fido (protein-threonine AMPylation protein) [Dysgonomonadaceae bacterium PH5-43]|nr:fido (protein-threonine AMPylation protein) [Dysgonomonadaceae bacterium PH5-43]
MYDFDEYIRQGELDKKEKSQIWQTAIGLQQVDGLKPSSYLIETAKQNIEGSITIDEVQQLIKSYYQSKDSRMQSAEETEEADKTSVNIAKLLNEQTFAFTLVGFIAVHRRIFEGVFKFAGKIRDYNITKKEWVLRGDTVLYVSAPDIRNAIEHDLEQEKAFDYIGLNMDQITNHIAKFVSGLWQIHPFGEGNTRTVAVFTIQYLRSMGFSVENDFFANYSWYFRNALVRANYQNIQKGVKRNTEYLELFFRNLLMGEKNELINRNMLIQAPQEILKNDSKKLDRTSTEQLTEQLSEKEKSVIAAIAHEQISLKELMDIIGIKHRPTFLENYINPALERGLIRTLYTQTPNHPRQKYLLTPKGLNYYELTNKA